MKRTIMPVIMLAVMMQLNGAASRASALWGAAHTSGLLRSNGQQVFTAGRSALSQGFVCPAGSRLLSSGSPTTALRVSGRFGALGKPSAPHAEEGYWSRFKRFFVPTGTAVVAAGAYMASQKGEEEPLAYRLPRGYAADEDAEIARAYYAGRERAVKLPVLKEDITKIQRLKDATERAETLFIEHRKLKLAGAPKAEVRNALHTWSRANDEVVAAEKALNPQYDAEQEKEQRESTQRIIDIRERELPQTLEKLSAQEAAASIAGDRDYAAKIRQLLNATERAETLFIEHMKLKLAGAPKAEVRNALHTWGRANDEVVAAEKALNPQYDAEQKKEQRESTQRIIDIKERMLPQTLEKLSAQEAQKSSRVQMLEENE